MALFGVGRESPTAGQLGVIHRGRYLSPRPQRRYTVAGSRSPMSDLAMK